jgi:hypothetical protein
MADYVADELSGFNGSESWGDPDTDLIWGRDPGGFMPFQLGGFEASQMIRFDIDSSYHVSEGMSDFANELQKRAFEDAMQELELPKDTEWDTLTEEQREVVFETEQAYFDDAALLRFECWLAGDPYPETEEEKALGKVMLRMNVNYRDGPYFRTKSDEVLHELEVSVEVLREAVKRWPSDYAARLWRQLKATKKES